MSELKCCPFCGGEAKYMEIKDFFVSRFVTCTKCGIETPRNCLNRKDAIKRWNTRTPMANIVEKLEEREKYLENAMKESHEKGYSSSEAKAMNERVAIRYAINIVKQEINKEN